MQRTTIWHSLFAPALAVIHAAPAGIDYAEITMGPYDYVSEYRPTHARRIPCCDSADDLDTTQELRAVRS